MSKIIVNTNDLRDYAQRLNSINNRLVRLDRRMDNLYFKVGLVDLLKLIQADILTGYSYRLKQASDYLVATASEFEMAERELAAIDPSSYVPVISPIASGAIMGGSTSVLTKTLKELRIDTEKSAFSKDAFIYKKTSKSEYADLEVGTYEGSFKDAEIKQDEKKIVDKAFDKNNKELKDPSDVEFYDKTGVGLELEAGAEASYSFVELKDEASGEYAEGEYDVKIGTAEAHASASAGMYVYEKTADGKTIRKFQPGVCAETGVSVAAFDASAEGRVGLGENHDELGLYGKGEVEAAAAEAEAKLSVTKDEVFVGASAEANLAKAEGSAGISVLGVDAGVTGSVSFGVGAHANAGITDGKLKVDIGVAVGLGASVGFELDVGGAVDSLCKASKSALNSIDIKIGSWFK